MIFLNNLWFLLTSESEIVSSIMTFPFYFIENFLCLYFFTTLIHINLSKKQKQIYVITVSLVSILSSIFIGFPFEYIFSFIFAFILLFKLYKQEFGISILSIIISFAIFSVANSLLIIPFTKVLYISTNVLMLTPIYKIIYYCFVYLFVFIIVFVIKHVKLYATKKLNFDRSINSIILKNVLLGIVILCVQGFSTYYSINIVPVSITILNLALLLIYFFLSFYSLTKTTELYLTTRQLENAENYNKSLTILYDNVKGFKHDFDNMVNTIGGYISANDLAGLKNYYSDLKRDCNDLNNVAVLNPNIINNPGIYNLLISKYEKATKLNIKINFEFFFDFTNLHMPIYEFSRILGILLDNAIEASKDCDERIINLVFRDSPRNNVQIVIIENTYLDRNVDTSKIFCKGVSGKENHSGIGLWEVKQIEKKYNNIVLHTSKDDYFFKQHLEIYY